MSSGPFLRAFGQPNKAWAEFDNTITNKERYRRCGGPSEEGAGQRTCYGKKGSIGLLSLVGGQVCLPVTDSRSKDHVSSLC